MSESVAMTEEDADEVEGELYDALGHLEAALAKLHLCESYALPPLSSTVRDYIDQLTDLVDEARAVHRGIAPNPDQAEDLERRLEQLYRERKGRMVDESWGWCVGCGRVKVCAADGDDTCRACLEGA